MKILVSAYACEPHRGSESEVGWRWAVEIARLGHEIWVLTRANNRQVIEPELARMPPLPRLHFAYYDLPTFARWWKRGPRGVHLYYRLWQWGAYGLAKRLHVQEKFDQVHHLTFVTIRHPSFLGRLGVPFVFGPVAGGESVPWALRGSLGVRGWFVEALRDFSNLVVALDPFVRTTFRQAKAIYVTSPETRELVPTAFRNKVRIQLAIGIDCPKKRPVRRRYAFNPGRLRILYVGRYINWKGLHLGLSAFARILSRFPETRLTVVGKGPEERRWRRLADKLGIAAQVDWQPWQRRDRLAELFRDHDFLLFPSLRDSGGMAVLEALGCGLPVVCLDRGGPGVMIDNTCGRVVHTEGRNEGAVVEALATSLEELCRDMRLRERLSDGAFRRAAAFHWSDQVRRLYTPEADVTTRFTEE